MHATLLLLVAALLALGCCAPHVVPMDRMARVKFVSSLARPSHATAQHMATWLPQSFDFRRKWPQVRGRGAVRLALLMRRVAVRYAGARPAAVRQLLGIRVD